MKKAFTHPEIEVINLNVVSVECAVTPSKDIIDLPDDPTPIN